MRFFRMQDQARRRSRRLVGWYCLAFAGTVASVSAVLGTLIAWLSPHEQLWWHYALPGALFTAMTVGLSLHRLRQIDDDGSAVAKALGGERLQLQQAHFLERRLLNLVAETAVAAGLPPPQVYLLRRDHSINAFAAGRSPECAVIGVTYGALVQLKRDELQAVVAHEFSHILNRDTRLNQRLSGWLYGLQGISSSGRYLLYGRDDTADDYRRRKNVDNHPFDNAVEIFFKACLGIYPAACCWFWERPAVCLPLGCRQRCPGSGNFWPMPPQFSLSAKRNPWSKPCAKPRLPAVTACIPPMRPNMRICCLPGCLMPVWRPPIHR